MSAGDVSTFLSDQESNTGLEGTYKPRPSDRTLYVKSEIGE